LQISNVPWLVNPKQKCFQLCTESVCVASVIGSITTTCHWVMVKV